VHGDAARIAQVLGNLLNNAAKFTPRGGLVTISVGADTAAREVIYRVKDNGIGLSHSSLSHLFQPFMQVDRALALSKGGLGLGLALAKGLVELHGGTVSVQSDGLGKGAEFTVRLPMDDTVAPELPPPRMMAIRRSRRVLVIEDNVDAAESLRDALELQDHRVEVAHEGPEGIVKARLFRPDVVLCDIGLPGMDGYAVARELRADDALKDVFLVALTGYTLSEDLKRASEAGFERHLAKPPSLDQLEDLLAGAGGSIGQ
jgi:CheY-like chemotaxis protein